MVTAYGTRNCEHYVQLIMLQYVKNFYTCWLWLGKILSVENWFCFQTIYACRKHRSEHIWTCWIQVYVHVYVFPHKRIFLSLTASILVIHLVNLNVNQYCVFTDLCLIPLQKWVWRYKISGKKKIKSNFN